MAAGGLIAGYLILLVLGYGVDGRGTFLPDEAGTVADWTGVLLTGLGILGLGYELAQLRRAQLDEAIRESNSLYLRVDTQPWRRNGSENGTLIRYFITNFGDRKVLELHVEVSDLGRPVPSDWWIQHDRHAVPPQGDVERCVGVLHCPAGDPPSVRLTDLVVAVRWRDAWQRRVTMIGNSPAVFA